MPETRASWTALARLGTDRRFVGDPRNPQSRPSPKSPTVTSPLPQDESRAPESKPPEVARRPRNARVSDLT